MINSPALRHSPVLCPAPQNLARQEEIEIRSCGGGEGGGGGSECGVVVVKYLLTMSPWSH